MTNTNFLPCPCCGEQPDVSAYYRADHDNYEARIRCPGKTCHLVMYRTGRSEEVAKAHALASWNRRTP